MKSPIQITLKRSSSALGSGDYIITRIKRAITVDASKRVNLRVGDILTTQEAEQLNGCRAYEVTVAV